MDLRRGEEPAGLRLAPTRAGRASDGSKSILIRPVLGLTLRVTAKGRFPILLSCRIVALVGREREREAKTPLACLGISPSAEEVIIERSYPDPNEFSGEKEVTP